MRAKQFFCYIFSQQGVSGLHYPRFQLPYIKIVLHLHYSSGKAITVGICFLVIIRNSGLEVRSGQKVRKSIKAHMFQVVIYNYLHAIIIKKTLTFFLLVTNKPGHLLLRSNKTIHLLSCSHKEQS